jgi:hypothetical protein
MEPGFQHARVPEVLRTCGADVEPDAVTASTITA